MNKKLSNLSQLIGYDDSSSQLNEVNEKCGTSGKLGGNIAVEACNVTKSFYKDSNEKIIVLDNISFYIKQNDCILIAGENGSGKSTLMHIIANLTKADAGKVRIFNNEKIGIVFQDADATILGETVIEDVLFSLKNISTKKILYNKKDIEKKAEEYLKKVGLNGKEKFSSRFLSGGEKRKLSVASILALERKIIIFDEPYANLDYNGVRCVNEIILMLKKTNHTVIILTHELEKSLGLCNRFVVLHKGKIVFDGTPQKGVNKNLEIWGIKNPLVSYTKLKDLVW